MKKQVYELDEYGFLKKVYVATVDENGKILDKDKQNFISVDFPNNLIKHLWNGSEWVEGATQSEKEEHESQQLIEFLKPSSSEIADAELEIKMLTMLTELGVIQ